MEHAMKFTTGCIISPSMAGRAGSQNTSGRWTTWLRIWVQAGFVVGPKALLGFGSVFGILWMGRKANEVSHTVSKSFNQKFSFNLSDLSG